jgi:spermidine synthase
MNRPSAPAAGLSWWRERSDRIGIAHALRVRRIHREQSRYQRIEVFEHPALGRILVLDGYIQATQADEFVYHEMAVHVPLLGRHREAASVLIIGGGDGGALREALVHPFVARVTMVEIDARVIEVSNRFLGIQGDYGDPRVTLVIDDAVAAVKRAADQGELYDVILLDLTEPVGPSLALFTEAFLADLCRLVSPEGVIVDSDSLYLTRSGGRFLQELSGGGENLVTAMRRSRLLPHVEAYRAHVPLYPGADFGFFLYGRDGVSLAEPVREHRGRHYDPAVHRAAFALPPWQREWLGLD